MQTNISGEEQVPDTVESSIRRAKLWLLQLNFQEKY